MADQCWVLDVYPAGGSTKGPLMAILARLLFVA